MDDVSGAPQGGGIMGRFENVETKKSRKRMVPCEAATSSYLSHDYLKPQHLPIDRVDQEVNFHAASNIHETRFHRGFQRRHKSDIRPDAARMEMEVMKEITREQRAQGSIEATREFKAKHTFNILTGEGAGRECEFRQVGKKIVNPFGCQEAVFAEHGRDASNRTKNSKHRFFHYPAVQNEQRAMDIFQEGLKETTRESAIIGYGQMGVRRTRTQSVGAADNFGHVRGRHEGPDWERPQHGNHSQIIFG